MNLGLERCEYKVVWIVEVRPLVDPVSPVHDAVADALPEGDLVVGVLLAAASLVPEICFNLMFNSVSNLSIF